jgi:hypothetical protein
LKNNKGYLFSDQNSLFGHRDVIGFGTKENHVIEIPRQVANIIIAGNHYSKNFCSQSTVHLGYYKKTDIMTGVLQFGCAMNPLSMDKVVSGTTLEEYLELNRMWFSPLSSKNDKSKAFSYAIKFIKQKYPKVKFIQSFADERCKKLGVVYQACNFKFFGSHDSIFWELDGRLFHNSQMTRDPDTRKGAKHLQDNKEKAIPHNLRQYRYLYFIKKSAHKKCLLKQQEYPKHGEIYECP